ncbi:hypothetical protein MBLNU13_g06600t1 [Cladosporium sp. NU13]
MPSLTLLLPFLSAFALASPTPGEVNPALRPSRPEEPTWYCTVRHRYVLDYFTLEGRNWHTDERKLKAAIASRGGAITNWFYEDRGQEFIAHWQLPIRMSHDVEENLSHLLNLNDAHGVICHKVD